MSKSLGNGIDPADVTNKWGADVLRLWVASADYAQDVSISGQHLEAGLRRVSPFPQHVPLPAGQPVRL